MRVSVVVCGYDLALLDDISEATESLLSQTHQDLEVVLVIDGRAELHEGLLDRFGDDDNVVLHCNDSNLGLARSRNIGIDLASGSIIAFMDDDAVARENWVEELLSTYERRDALAVGGKMEPLWVAGRPGFLPEEFYWLIGVSHRGTPTEECEVRNTFGSNISFRAIVLEELGGFDSSLGIRGERQVQGEETELATQVESTYGESVWYNPDAIVYHKIFEFRTRLSWLTKRAFWQGYTKYIMPEPPDASTSEERTFLITLFTEHVPSRIVSTGRRPTREKVAQIAMIFILTSAVGVGYLYAAMAGIRNTILPNR